MVCSIDLSDTLMDYSTLGTVQLTNVLIEKFKNDRGDYNTASHKFYSIRKQMAKDTGCDTFMKVQPKNFFYSLKCHKESIKLQNQTIKRSASAYQSRLKSSSEQHKSFDGDFDDLDCSKRSNAYFYHNKHYNQGKFDG